MGVSVLDIDRLIEVYEESCEVYDWQVRSLIDLYHEKAIKPAEVDRLVDELLAFYRTEFEMEP